MAHYSFLMNLFSAHLYYLGFHASWNVLDYFLSFQDLQSPGIYPWFNLTNMPFMYRTPCVNRCMKYSCYVLSEQFSLQLVTNVLRWIVLSHCIYRV